MSASMRFLTRSLFSAGFLLFNWPSRMAKVLYLLKLTAWSNSTVTFCAKAPRAASKISTADFIPSDFITTWSLTLCASVRPQQGEGRQFWIWEYARNNGFVIVTADSDFLGLAEERGAPR